MSMMAPRYISLPFRTPAPGNAPVNGSVPFVSIHADKYKLFRYVDTFAKAGTRLGGFPVLFVPGNRGRCAAVCTPACLHLLCVYACRLVRSRRIWAGRSGLFPRGRI